jgi:TPR repeat protein
MATDLADALIRPPQDFVGSMDLAIELRLADDSVADRKTLHAEWMAPPPAAKPAPALAQAPVAPSAPAAPALMMRQLDREEVAALVRRGEDFIASGDLASARLLLQHAAESGDVRAALALAGTYDPNVLEKLGVQGLAADIGMARVWYQRAREFGSVEAPRRLEQLARASTSP